MMNTRIGRSIRRIVAVACCLLGTALMAGSWDGAWFVSADGRNRYNVETGTAEYQQDGRWVYDGHPESNPAVMEFRLEGYSSAGFDAAGKLARAANSEEVSVWVKGRLVTASQWWMAQTLGSHSGFTSFESSALPGWDLHLDGGLAYDQRDFSAGGQTYKAISQSFDLALYGRHDRNLFVAALRAQHSDGRDAWDGSDADLYNFSLMPGRRLLAQETNGVNVDAYGVLDLTYAGYSNVNDQLRLAPGLAVAASRATDFGLFHLVYLYSRDWNTNGDRELGGHNYLDVQGLNGGWALPVASHLVLSTALDYSRVMDMPHAVPNDFTSAILGLRTQGFERWGGGVEYRQSLDRTADHGIRASVSYSW
jgi:hypothetical protein